jgi:drug/metabolite transporter (DMT)-like permease
MKTHIHASVFYALGAAALFGASTPLAKHLLGSISPLLLAGLLYLGSGMGLAVARLVRDRGWQPLGLPAGQWPWLLGAMVSGGVLGPTLLMIGLATTLASTASLLLNLEAVLTAVIAWTVFKENTDRRIVLGMALIVAGSLLLSWPGHLATGHGTWIGPVLIAGACLCWAIDNNLTRKVSASDALFVAGFKGLVAGTVNMALAFALGAHWPTPDLMLQAGLIGLLGYGVSLVLFVLALRGLGAARTGAYFSTAPFVGAALAIVLFHDSTSVWFWGAALVMGVGVWLHLTEAHSHSHTHEAMEHDHPHVHDAHHRHEHDFPWDGKEPHTHPHRHELLTHAHPHYPDVDHQHRH